VGKLGSGGNPYHATSSLLLAAVRFLESFPDGLAATNLANG